MVAIIGNMVEYCPLWFGNVWRRPIKAPVGMRVGLVVESLIVRGTRRSRKTIRRIIKRYLVKEVILELNTCQRIMATLPYICKRLTPHMISASVTLFLSCDSRSWVQIVESASCEYKIRITINYNRSAIGPTLPCTLLLNELYSTRLFYFLFFCLGSQSHLVG